MAGVRHDGRVSGPTEPEPPADPSWERPAGQPASWERPPGQPASWEQQAWGSPQQQPQQPQQQQPYPQPYPQQPYPQQHGQQYGPQYGGGYPAYGGYPAPQTSSKASTVQVLGIVSLVMFFVVCGLGFIPAVIALALAPGARREIEASGGALGGASQLRAGKIMAWITLGLTALGLIILIAVIALAVSASDSTTTFESLAPGGAFDLRARAG